MIAHYSQNRIYPVPGVKGLKVWCLPWAARRSKSFCCHDISFGWSTIKRMWDRELDQAQKGLMFEVPRLLERHMDRDVWTKLNVLPAKIMQVTYLYILFRRRNLKCTLVHTTFYSQQDHVLSEIQQYHCASDQMTVTYLTALNNLFERGIWGKSTHLLLTTRMKGGFDFFCVWRDDVIGKGNKMAEIVYAYKKLTVLL